MCKAEDNKAPGERVRQQREQPFASVIVPVFNAEDMIGECIEALLKQDYPKDRHEITIVDNDSTDRTAEIIKRYPVTYLLEDKVHTSYAARNTGARRAKGEALVFCDADQLADPDWLTELLSMWDDRRYVAFGGRIPVFPVNESLVARAFSFDRRASGADRICSSNSPLAHAGTGNMAVRAEAFWQVGGFRDTVPTGEDYAICQRLREATGGQILKIGSAFQWHRSRTSLWGYIKPSFRGGIQMELRRRKLLKVGGDYAPFLRALARALWLTVSSPVASVRGCLAGDRKDEWDVRLAKPYLVAAVRWAGIAGRVCGRLFGTKALPRGW